MIPLYFWLLNATAGEINALLEETDIARRMLPSQPISAKSSVIDLESPTFAQKSSKQNEPTLK